MHTITTGLATGIIEVDASGFWTIAHVEDFLRNLEREGRRVLATASATCCSAISPSPRSSRRR